MEISDRPQCENELIVLNPMRVALEPVRQSQFIVTKVDVLDLAREKLHFPQELSHRVGDGGQLQIARGNLVQHRCEQKEVVAIDQGDFDVRVSAEPPLQFQGGIEAAEAPAQNIDPILHRDQAPWASADSSTPLKRRSASNQSTSGDPTGHPRSTHRACASASLSFVLRSSLPAVTSSSHFNFLSILTSSISNFVPGCPKVTPLEKISPGNWWIVVKLLRDFVKLR